LMRWVSRSLTGCAHGRQHHPPRHDGGAPRRCGDRIRTCGARRTNHSLTRRFVPIHPPTYPKWGLSGMVVTGVPVAGPGSGSVRSSNPCVGHCCRTMRAGQAVAGPRVPLRQWRGRTFAPRTYWRQTGRPPSRPEGDPSQRCRSRGEPVGQSDGSAGQCRQASLSSLPLGWSP